MLYTLAVLACPISMGAMMLFMGRRRRRGVKAGEAGRPTPEELASLKAELARINERIREIEGVDELEALPAPQTAGWR